MHFLLKTIITFGPSRSTGHLQELSRHPDDGPVSQVVPRCNPSSLFQPPDGGARCCSGGLAFLFPVGSRSGLDVWYRLLEGMSNPSPLSLEEFIFCRLLLGSFPEFFVADGLRTSDPKDSSKAGVDECLDLLQCRNRGSPCFSFIKQDRFYCGVKILMLMSMVRLDEVQMFFIWREAALTPPFSLLRRQHPPPPLPLFVNNAT